MRPILRTVKSVIEDAQYALNDAAGAVWSGAQMARAYNFAIDAWGDRIRCPALYPLPDGEWSDSVYSYSIPGGMDPSSIRPQFRRPLSSARGLYLPTDEGDPWTDFASFSVEPDSTGGFNLRFAFAPQVVEGRILHYVRPGRIGYNGNNFYVESAVGLSGSADSTILTGAYDAARQGFVKVGSEWIYYGDLNINNTQTNMLSMVRGYNGTSALNHGIDIDIYWGVAAERASDFNGIVDSICAECHRMKLGVVSAADAQYHQQMVNYYNNKVKEAMRYRSRQGGPRMVLDPNFSFWT